MLLPIARRHWFEIDDQPWFPSFLRERVQASLTILWTLKVPIIQGASCASLLANKLRSILGSALQSYTFVDFCSGGGGPTPFVERNINRTIRGNAAWSQTKSTANDIELVQLNGAGKTQREGGVDFVLTDIHPHLEAWERAAKKSDRLKYIESSVDAGDAPKDILALATGDESRQQKKVFRLFSLAFHHFDDPAARRILQNTLETSSGFGIFELQDRTLEGLLTALVLFPSLWAGSWYWFWGDWTHLFWTYVIPVVPFVVVFDGLMSCVRMRSGEEILRLMEGLKGKEGWRFETGSTMHTWPTGRMTYFVGIKDD
ncbi:MAG: hypothetical protein HETSPECPRED_001570 [Heterodermia speciosa]|uniref:Uncharacterized protein n=1 Tax=Heterodermia speciosa TaxID=116794 RepID=A0A8H3I3D3_9LECA|nr:MAG: hypothetical protein HETSPECPRED_001570 [Heterodermia speciosa]